MREQERNRPLHGAEEMSLALDALLARQATLITVLADGSEHRRTGLVAQAAAEDSEAASPATV